MSIRDEKNGRFLQGHSGNPDGRPKGSKSLTDLLRQHLNQDGKREAIIEKVVDLAIQGERWATELVWDRLEGKPLQVIDIEQRIIEAAEREGVDPQEAVETAQRILEEDRWS